MTMPRELRETFEELVTSDRVKYVLAKGLSDLCAVLAQAGFRQGAAVPAAQIGSGRLHMCEGGVVMHEPSSGAVFWALASLGLSWTSLDGSRMGLAHRWRVVHVLDKRPDAVLVPMGTSDFCELFTHELAAYRVLESDLSVMSALAAKCEFQDIVNSSLLCATSAHAQAFVARFHDTLVP